VEGVASFYELVRHINTEHSITVLLVSHEVNMVATISTRVVCLNKDLIYCGEPETAMTRHMLERLYGRDYEIRRHDHSRPQT
jgi:zinc transport system ATP-binding protein